MGSLPLSNEYLGPVHDNQIQASSPLQVCWFFVVGSKWNGWDILFHFTPFISAPARRKLKYHISRTYTYKYILQVEVRIYRDSDLKLTVWIGLKAKRTDARISMLDLNLTGGGV